VLLCARHDFFDLFGSERDRQHAILEAVIREDIGKRRRKDRPKSKLAQRPRCMLPRRSTTKILPRNKNRRAFVTWLIENESWIRTPIVKQKLTKPRTLDAFQKLLRDDLIRVNVRAIERRKPVCFIKAFISFLTQRRGGAKEDALRRCAVA
jgi:hypothetical protein